MTYGEALKNHPHKAEILSMLHVKSSDEIPHPRFVPDPQDRKFKRVIDTVEYMERTARGFHLSYMWED